MEWGTWIFNLAHVVILVSTESCYREYFRAHFYTATVSPLNWRFTKVHIKQISCHIGLTMSIEPQCKPWNMHIQCSEINRAMQRNPQPRETMSQINRWWRKCNPTILCIFEFFVTVLNMPAHIRDLETGSPGTLTPCLTMAVDDNWNSTQMFGNTKLRKVA